MSVGIGSNVALLWWNSVINLKEVRKRNAASDWGVEYVPRNGLVDSGWVPNTFVVRRELPDLDYRDLAPPL